MVNVPLDGVPNAPPDAMKFAPFVSWLVLVTLVAPEATPSSLVAYVPLMYPFTPDDAAGIIAAGPVQLVSVPDEGVPNAPPDAIKLAPFVSWLVLVTLVAPEAIPSNFVA